MCSVHMYGTYCTLTVDPESKTPRIDAFASDRCLNNIDPSVFAIFEFE